MAPWQALGQSITTNFIPSLNPHTIVLSSNPPFRISSIFSKAVVVVVSSSSLKFPPSNHNVSPPTVLRIFPSVHYQSRKDSISICTDASEHDNAVTALEESCKNERLDPPVGREVGALVANTLLGTPNNVGFEPQQKVFVDVRQEEVSPREVEKPDFMNGANYNPGVKFQTEGPPLVIEISGELLGVFKYVEKLKRAKVKVLADILLQLAISCSLLTLVRGVGVPIVEVFKTTPPSWGKLIGMSASIDYAAVVVLALRARVPMLQIAGMVVETQANYVEAMERQEEVMITVVNELTTLFTRMRNVLFMVAFTHFFQIIYTGWRMYNPVFVANSISMVKSLVLWPWPI